MEPMGQPLPRKSAAAPTSGGDLILQNGRQSGSVRTLGVPLTFLGRAARCEIRLNVKGVDPLHCLLVQGPEGLIVRDLDSASGTFVNGQRIAHALLHDGDLLNVGPFQFRLRLAPAPKEDSDDSLRAPLRLQAAAVAAQQAALSEEEAKLVQRRTALEQQEEQLAAHLEEKRRKLVLLSERAQAERSALEQDRAGYDQHIAKVTGDLTQTQREMLESQQKMQAERKRLMELQKRIRQRWHRFWFAERQKFNLREEQLQAEARALEEQNLLLQEREKVLAGKRLRFHALYELGRGHLRDAWTRLRQDQFRWKHRRGKERAALKVRGRDVENAERQLLEAQRLFLKEKRAWDAKKGGLQSEVDGLEARVQNQRLKVLDQQDELVRLDLDIAYRQQMLEGLPEPPAVPQPADAVGQTPPATPALVAPGVEGAPVPQPLLKPDLPFKMGPKKLLKKLAAVVSESKKESVELPDTWPERFRELERLAGDLADQRLQLVEQWQRLGILHEHWEKDRLHASVELEELARRLVEKGHVLAEREQASHQADQVLRQRHDELVQIRQQMIAWRARLRVREKAWQGERTQLLTEVRNREELADQHLNTLVDLRHRWAKRRRQELEKLRDERQSFESLRKEFGQQRLQLTEQTTALEEEKRILAEKALALEQYRKEFLSKGEENPAAERRIERLRRRWITQNASAIRATTKDREHLQAELTALEARHADLQKRADALSQAELDLTEKMTAWEHKQALAAARQTRIQLELQSAEAQRQLFEQQVAKMKEEIERIARALIDEPDPPTSLALKAA